MVSHLHREMAIYMIGDGCTDGVIARVLGLTMEEVRHCGWLIHERARWRAGQRKKKEARFAAAMASHERRLAWMADKRARDVERARDHEPAVAGGEQGGASVVPAERGESVGR